MVQVSLYSRLFWDLYVHSPEFFYFKLLSIGCCSNGEYRTGTMRKQPYLGIEVEGGEGSLPAVWAASLARGNTA